MKGTRRLPVGLVLLALAAGAALPLRAAELLIRDVAWSTAPERLRAKRSM
jgi:hypothetical protein